jgi:hypothetical protein
LTGVLMHILFMKITVVFYRCCRWCRPELARAATNDRSGVVQFGKNVLPDDPCVASGRSFLRINSCHAWLQSLYIAGCGEFRSWRSQLQQVGTLAEFCFCGHSRWRCPLPHHWQRVGCLQCTQMWRNADDSSIV